MSTDHDMLFLPSDPGESKLPGTLTEGTEVSDRQTAALGDEI